MAIIVLNTNNEIPDFMDPATQRSETGQINLGDNAFRFVPDEHSLLGQGTFGTVYRGTNSNDEGVAIKQLVTSRIKVDELMIMTRVNSDFIVTMIDYFQTPQFTYVVMELCDCDLNKFLTEQGPLSLPNLNVVLHDLAAGYLVLDKQGVIHRDIKPHNIMVVHPDGRSCAKIARVKLSDFSSSRILQDCNDQLSNLAGSPRYMAPEIGANIVDKTRYNASVDMWSIGVVVFQCINGKVPFDERALCKLFIISLSTNYGSFKVPDHTRSVPLKYVEIVSRLMDINPQTRMTSMELVECTRYLAKDASSNDKTITFWSSLCSNVKVIVTKIGEKLSFTNFLRNALPFCGSMLMSGSCSSFDATIASSKFDV